MEDNFNINNENSEEKSTIRFDVKETVDIVSTENTDKKSKPAIIIVIAVILVAVVCGLVFYFAGSKDATSSEEETTTDLYSIDYNALESAFNEENFTNEEGASISAEEYKEYVQNIVSEATTALNDSLLSANPHTIVEKTTVPGEETTKSAYDMASCEALVKAFLDRSCYLEGSLTDAGGSTPVAVAFDGNNFEMLTNLDGTEVAIIKIDGKLYFKRAALKQYAQLTDAVMQTFGLSVDMLTFDFSDKNYDSMKDSLTSITDVTIDEKDGVCFRYDKNGGFFNFYFIDNQLVQLDVGESSQVNSQFIISYFTASVPGDMLSLKGYKETGFMTLFADFMDE